MNYYHDLNQILLRKRDSDDESFTLNMPEHKLKKNAGKFNFALKDVYDAHKDRGVKMFHILLSINEFFDMEWLVKNILDRKNKLIVKQEMQEEYNVKIAKERKSTKSKVTVINDITDDVDDIDDLVDNIVAEIESATNVDEFDDYIDDDDEGFL